jgi:hypothetical protein
MVEPSSLRRFSVALLAVFVGALHPVSYMAAELYALGLGKYRSNGEIIYFSNLKFIDVALAAGLLRLALFAFQAPRTVSLAKVCANFTGANWPVMLMLPLWIFRLHIAAAADWFGPDGGRESGMPLALIELPIFLASAALVVPGVWMLSRRRLQSLRHPR